MTPERDPAAYIPALEAERMKLQEEVRQLKEQVELFKRSTLELGDRFAKTKRQLAEAVVEELELRQQLAQAKAKLPRDKWRVQYADEIKRLQSERDLWKSVADSSASVLKAAGAPDFQDAAHAHQWANEAAKLQAQSAAMRELLMKQDKANSARYRIYAPDSLMAEIKKALATNAGQELIDRLERWEALAKLVPQPPNAITWEHGVELLNKLQALAWSSEALKGAKS